MAAGEWIVGEIEADFEGATAAAQEGDAALAPGGRLFGLKLLRGQVRGARLCDGPPAGGQGPVFRQSVLAPAWIETPAGGGPPTFAEATLHALELHDVRIQHQVEEPAPGLLASVEGRERAGGVLRATVYARLTPPPEPPAPPPPGPPPRRATPLPRPAWPAPRPWTPAPARRSCLWPGFWWALAIALFFYYLWVRCGLRLALVWLAGLVLARLLRCWLWRRGWFVPRTRAGAILSGILGVLFVVLWNLIVLRWCPGGRPECCGGETVRRVRERVEEALASDKRAEQVSDATRSLGNAGQRLSLDDALADPESFYGSCTRTIYLSDDVLFDWNEAALKPGAEVQLRKLARLLDQRPDARIRLVGHADASGDRDYNRKLSVRRAREVARWLETRGIPSQRLEAVGRGADEPISNDPGQWHLNRRVEVAVPCAPGVDSRSPQQVP